MRFILKLILLISLHASAQDVSLFERFQYSIDGDGTFVLSSDNKSFYTNDIKTMHRIKQIDIDSADIIAMTPTDDRNVYAMLAWKGYLIAQIKTDGGDQQIALYNSIGHDIKRIRSKSLSESRIVKAMIKDEQHILIIDELGAVFELDEKLNTTHRYQLEVLADSHTFCYDDENAILYYVTLDDRIKGFDLNNNKESFSSAYLGTNHRLYQIRLNKTKDKLIAGLGDELSVYDLNTGRVRKIGENLVYVNALAISPDFKTIISTGLGGVLKVWDYETGVLKKRFEVASLNIVDAVNASIDSVAFIDNDRFLYASEKQDVRMARLSDNRLLRDYGDKTSYIRLKKLPQNRLAFFGANGTVSYYDLSTGSITHTDKLPLDNVRRIISDKHERLLITQEDTHFILYNIKRKQYKDYGVKLEGHNSSYFALNPRYNMYARIGLDNKIQLFDMDRQRSLKTFSSRVYDSVNIFTFLDENILFISGKKAGYTKDDVYASQSYMQFIDIRDRRTYERSSAHINSYDMSDNKRFLLTAGADRSIELWQLDLKNLKNIKVSDMAYGVLDEVSGVRFNQAEDKVISLGRNGSVVLRDINLATGRFGEAKVLRRAQSKSQRYFNAIFYDNDQKFVVDDVYDNLNFMDANTGEILYRLVLLDNQYWLKLYPDGRHVFLDSAITSIPNTHIKDESLLQENNNHKEDVAQEAAQREQDAAQEKARQYRMLSHADFTRLSLEELHELKRWLYGFYAYTDNGFYLWSLFDELEKRSGTKEDVYRDKWALFYGVKTRIEELNERLQKGYGIRLSYHFSFADGADKTVPSHLKIRWLDKGKEWLLWRDRVKGMFITGDNELTIELKDEHALKMRIAKDEIKEIGGALLSLIGAIAHIERDLYQDKYRYQEERFYLDKAFIKRIRMTPNNRLYETDPTGRLIRESVDSHLRQMQKEKRWWKRRLNE